MEDMFHMFNIHEMIVKCLLIKDVFHIIIH